MYIFCHLGILIISLNITSFLLFLFTSSGTSTYTHVCICTNIHTYLIFSLHFFNFLTSLSCVCLYIRLIFSFQFIGPLEFYYSNQHLRRFWFLIIKFLFSYFSNCLFFFLCCSVLSYHFYVFLCLSEHFIMPILKSLSYNLILHVSGY